MLKTRIKQVQQKNENILNKLHYFNEKALLEMASINTPGGGAKGVTPVNSGNLQGLEDQLKMQDSPNKDAFGRERKLLSASPSMRQRKVGNFSGHIGNTTGGLGGMVFDPK